MPGNTFTRGPGTWGIRCVGPGPVPAAPGLTGGQTHTLGLAIRGSKCSELQPVGRVWMEGAGPHVTEEPSALGLGLGRIC